MRCKVPRIAVDRKSMQELLDQFLNRLEEGILGVIPNVRPTFQLMGATAKVDYLLVVEKVR